MIAPGIVVIDTNIINGPAFFERLAYRATRKVCEAAGIEIGITGVTYHESLNLQVSNARTWINQLANSSRSLGAILELNTFIPDIKEVEDAWEAVLRENFRIYTLEGSDAVEALRREALRLAPAKESGRGARDCAIWLTVLRLACEGRRVYLVTNNSKDFGEAPDLRSDLQNEVDKCGADIIYISSLEMLLENISSGSISSHISDNVDAARILSSAVKIKLLDELKAEIGDGLITANEILDASIYFSDLKIKASYKIADFAVVLVEFDFAVEGIEVLGRAIAGSGESFVRFDIQFGDFRVAEHDDVKILSREL